MEIFEEVKKMLQPKCKGKEITLNTYLRDLNIDSLELIDIVMDAEKKYGITFEDELLFQIKTVDDIVKAIEDLKK